MKKKIEKLFFGKKNFLIGLAVRIMPVICFFIACVSNSSAIQKKEALPPPVLPENAVLIDTVDVEIETEAGNYPSVLSALLFEAQTRHGNNIGIINIVVQSPKNNEDGKVISSGSAIVIRMEDDNYQELYDITPKSDDRIYGMGSARMSVQIMSMTVAESRARAEIARTYKSTIKTSEETAVSTGNVIIKESNLEQIVFSPNGTVWIMLSVNKENIKLE